MSQRRALVIGGSMSGLLAAVMLDRRGWEVDDFERVSGELAGRGAGIVAQPELIARLDKLGLDTRDLGVAIARRQMLDREGRVTAASACPQVLTTWERAYRVLRDACLADRYHRGRGVMAFDQNGRGVVAHFSDGRTAAGDVLIGADGLHSTVRQQCLPSAALAQALDAGEVEDALRRFEQERLPENKRIIECARHPGAYLQATQSAEERGRSACRGIPEAVLGETAFLDFLYA